MCFEIEDLTIIWPGEVPDSQWERLGRKEYIRLFWTGPNGIGRACSKTITLSLEKWKGFRTSCSCTRVLDHKGPCMAFQARLETVQGKGHTFKLEIDRLA